MARRKLDPDEAIPDPERLGRFAQPWEAMTNQEIVDLWHTHAKSWATPLSARTVARYRASIIEWVRWIEKGASLQRAQIELVKPRRDRKPPEVLHHITQAARSDVYDWLHYLERERVITDKRDGARYHSPLSASGVKNALAAVRSLYRFMMEQDDTWKSDPTYGVARPKVEIVQRDVLTREELQRLLDFDRADPNHNRRQRALTYLLAYTGCRVQSIADLKWRDVDLGNDVIYTVGKGDKRHTIDVLPPLKLILAQWQVWQLQQAEENADLARALGKPDTAYVLLTDTGKQMAQSSLWRTLKRRAHNADVRVIHPGRDARGRTKDRQSEVSPHMLRATFATILLENGVPLSDVSDLLAHADPSTTKRHYINPRDDRRREMMERFQVA